MPKDRPKNIIKGFGKGVNVALQDSLARGSRPTGDFDISDGIVVQVPINGGAGQAFHQLGREPIGAAVINSDQDGTGATARTDNQQVKVTIHSGSPSTVAVWVF